MWQDRLLTLPAFFVFKAENTPLADLISLKTCLEDGLVALELNPLFLKNTAYITRFIKIYRSHFRSFPILQLLRKIKLAIQKIDKNNARATVTNILSGYPIHIGTGVAVELPNVNYLEYSLAKVLAHAHIMLRLLVCSKKCALYFVHFLQTGHYVEVSTMMIALLGHIWYQARQCLLSMEGFYNKLHTYSSLFPAKKAEDGFRANEFPSDFSSSIGQDWKDEVDIDADEANRVFQRIAKESAESGGDLPELPKLPRKVQSLQKTKLETKCDVGEVVSRDSVQPAAMPSNATTSNPVAVVGKRSLINFLKTENEYRTKNSSKSLTKGISQFHWEKFRSMMEGKTKTPNVNIKDVFEKEWSQFLSKKC